MVAVGAVSKSGNLQLIAKTHGDEQANSSSLNIFCMGCQLVPKRPARLSDAEPKSPLRCDQGGTESLNSARFYLSRKVYACIRRI